MNRNPFKTFAFSALLSSTVLLATAVYGQAPVPLAATSVTPNSGSGLSLAFSAVYTDSSGAADLQVVYLDLGTSVLGANSCIVAYVPFTKALYLFNDAGNSSLGPITGGTNSTLSNRQCTLSASGDGAIQSGNHLTTQFAITFSAGFSGTKNIYGLAQSYSGSNGGWQTLGTWTPGLAAPLSSTSVAPASGAGLTSTFKAVYTDPNGASDLQVVYLDYGSSIMAPNSCIVAYVLASNALYLFNDASNGAVPGTITPGGNETISNSQCRITGAGGLATQAGTNLTVPVAVAFMASFGGTKNAYGLAQNYAGANGGWQTLGNWTPVTVALAATSVTPVNGSGLGPEMFRAVYTDPAGGSDIHVVYLGVGTSILGVNSCVVAYVPSNRALYLFGDTNASLGPITAGTNATLSNSQCTLSGSGGLGTIAGNSLTVPFAITFNSTFAGSKNVYGLAQNTSGVQGGWQTLGAWTPQFASVVAPTTPIRGCTTIGTSGSYQVMNPISGDNCLTITGGTVSVSCAAGATIGNLASTHSQPAVNIGQASVTLTGCTMQVMRTSPSFIKSPLTATNSSVTLNGNTVIGGETYLENSVTTINGGVYETLQVNGGAATFNGNPSFTATPNRGYVTHVVLVNNGGVLFAHSGTLTGNWSGTTTEAVAVPTGDGVDDTLLFDHVGFGGIVQNVSFTGAFDVGIENIGLVAGWTISDNQFSRMGYGCVGGWYASSWDSNTLQRNTCRVSANAVSPTPQLFSWAYYQWGGALDPIIYFRNNTVTDNIWVPDSTVSPGCALWVDPTFATAYGSTVIASGNTFARNNFRSSVVVAFSAHMLPASSIIDGGSNLGHSVTWPDQQAPYPLRFQ